MNNFPVYPIIILIGLILYFFSVLFQGLNLRKQLKETKEELFYLDIELEKLKNKYGGKKLRK